MGITLEAKSLADDCETVVCDYPAFPDHFGFFLPLAGITTVKQIREDAFDIRATGRLNRLYLELLRENADWSSEQRRRDMNHFIGSGVIEAGCKTVIGRRLKQSGMFWGEAGAENILQLRCLLKSPHFESARQAKARRWLKAS